MAFTFGKLTKNLIKLSCITVDAAQKAVCYVTADFIDNPENKKSLQKFSNQISDAINDVSVPVSNFAEDVIDGSVVLAGDITGGVTKKYANCAMLHPKR